MLVANSVCVPFVLVIGELRGRGGVDSGGEEEGLEGVQREACCGLYSAPGDWNSDGE